MHSIGFGCTISLYEPTELGFISKIVSKHSERDLLT